MIRLEEGSYYLLMGDERLEPLSVEQYPAGFCDRCGSELQTLAYHRTGSGWFVSARCSREHLVVMRYDLDWNWLGDEELQISTRDVRVSALPRERLEAVFTHAEIRDMLACEEGRPYVRQNLYRARAKYDRFEKLFGVRLKL
ncbi:MAG: hypothetical protein QUS08_01075 [Methanothrix sp.]|nr:hypothetical protein [Methanothrix sp.]